MAVLHDSLHESGLLWEARSGSRRGIPVEVETLRLPRRAPAPGVTRIAMVLAVSGLPASARAAPARCDLVVTAAPPSLAAGVRQAVVRVAARQPDLQIRASSGSIRPTPGSGAGATAEFTVASPSPPVVILGAVGGSGCGFSVLRVTAPPSAAASPGPAMLVMTQPAAAPADQDSEVLVYAFAVDERGAPRRGGAPTFRSETGVIEGVEQVGPGAWRGRWKIPAAQAEVSLVGAVFGTDAPVMGLLSRTPGAPAALEIEEDPASNAEGVPGAVIVRIRDSAGNLTDTDAPLAMESDVAMVGLPVRLERGVYRAPLAIAAEVQGKAIVTATTNRIFGTNTLTIAPVGTRAAKITIGAHPPILADGSARGRLEVLPITVADAAGDPVTDVPAGSAEQGEFLEALLVGPGSWALPYRPPRVLEDTVDHVTVRAGKVSATSELQLLAGRFSGSIGPKAGLAVGGGVGPALGLDGSLWWLVGRTQLGLTLDLSWWTVVHSSSPTVGGSASGYSARQRYLPATLALSWRKPFANRWLVWVSAGGGAAVVWNTSTVSGQPSVSEHGVAPAASLSVSAGRSLGPGFPFLEVRLAWVGDPKLSTLTGSSVTVLFLLGYRFDVV